MTTLVVVMALETRIREGIADFGSVYRYIANIYCNNTILRLVGHIYHIILFILCSTLIITLSFVFIETKSISSFALNVQSLSLCLPKDRSRPRRSRPRSWCQPRNGRCKSFNFAW